MSIPIHEIKNIYINFFEKKKNYTSIMYNQQKCALFQKPRSPNLELEAPTPFLPLMIIEKALDTVGAPR